MEKTEQQLRNEYEELSKLLGQPDIMATERGRQAAKRHSELGRLLDLFDQQQELGDKIVETEAMQDDEQLRELATQELSSLKHQLEQVRQQLEEALVPTDPRDTKNTIIEIRAGAGGDEASLFAGELYRMYARFAEGRQWRAEILSASPSEVGGYKEVIFKVSGQDAYGTLKFESGVHRVQRVPATESGGRIHTSTATVAVLPEAEEADIEIDPADLRVDVFRSSGPGGQSVNTTDSAVRITHEPTGITVTCQDEKSQHKNKAKALNVLRSRLLALKIEAEQQAAAEARKSQIGTGDRSEKIRTYNFPQDRVTDHRINLSVKNLPGVLDGKIDKLIEALEVQDRQLKKEASQ